MSKTSAAASRQKLVRLVLTALLTALIIVMAFTPLGYLKAGVIEITFITIPVIIGAVLLGPVGGLFLGAVFGITSFIQCFGMSTFGVALFSVSPLRTAIVCIVPRVLMGWLTAVIFKAISSKDKTSFVQYLVASIAGPLLNTILFTGTLLLLFNNAPIIIQLKEQFKEYRRRRDAFIANLEAEKEANLKVKQAIIEELKELVNSDETLNHTFNKFRELQQRWKDTGIVPQQHVKDLWETYNLHVENFYSFIKINKELRDLDLKKNYEQKVALCEQAEALVLEPSVVEAFHKLQKLHDEWRETGPVANEYKEALWERFKAASSRINKQHQEHFETLKGEQVKNLELKTGLCVATEELSSQPLTTRKEWNRASDRLLEIQKTWKTIGFAPKKDNNRIYERFRTACDRFFEAKRQFYAGMKTEMEHNLQLKIEICEAAESLMNSEEWKKATDELIALQARWKQIGAVSRRHSDAVWKRFRAACDKFFERKASHFASVDGEHEENLQKKLALLAEMAGADVKAGGYEVIREFQRRWGEIGFVPIKQKDAIQKKYKAAVDELFNTLRGSERDRSMGRFREKVSSFKASGDRRLRSERERLYNKVRQLEQEIGLLENNIGFFAKSKNAEALVADVRAKIERAREEMASTIEKVKLIDKQDQDENNNA